MPADDFCSDHSKHDASFCQVNKVIKEMKDKDDKIFDHISRIDSDKLNFKTFVIILSVFCTILGAILGYMNVNINAMATDMKAQNQEVLKEIRTLSQDVAIVKNDVDHMKEKNSIFQRFHYPGGVPNVSTP